MALPSIHVYISQLIHYLTTVLYFRHDMHGSPSSSTPLCATDSPPPRCYPHSRDLRARAAPPALLDTQPFRQSSKYSFTIVEQLTPRPMLPLPHLSDFDDDDDDVHPAPSVPPRATTHCRHSRHITTLRTTNLTEIDFYDILGIPCSRIDDR